jgi:hypothetical protein
MIRDIFNKWVDKKAGEDFDRIDEISKKLNIDLVVFFKDYKKRRVDDCVGYEIITEMFNDFIFYVSKKFQEPINNFLVPSGKNIYGEPTYSLYVNLEYDKKEKKFYLLSEDKTDLKTVFKILTPHQKLKLLENHIFSYIIKQTKFKIFNKKDIRYLKLKKINEY